jgi:hypothetical protein
LLYEIIAKANNNPKAKNRIEENKKGYSDNDDDRSEFEVGEWRPSMNLFELIQYIPAFIDDVLSKQNTP